MFGRPDPILTMIGARQEEIHSSVKAIAESSARTEKDVSALREEFHVSRERHEQRLTAVEGWQAGMVAWMRWLIPLLISGSILGGGYAAVRSSPALAPRPQYALYTL